MSRKQIGNCVFAKTTTLTRIKLLRTPVLCSPVGHYLLCQRKMLKKSDKSGWDDKFRNIDIIRQGWHGLNQTI